MSRRSAAFVLAAIVANGANAAQQPPPGPRRATAVVHLLDALPEAARSSLHSPALTPPQIGALAPLLCELEFVASLPGDRSIYLLPIPVDRTALDSLRLDPTGPRPQLVAGSRFVAAERLAAFRPLKQRVTPDGRRVCCVDKPMELKLPVDRMGPAARLTLVGGPFPRELAAAMKLVVDGRPIQPRFDPAGASGAAATNLAALTFELPDALGLTMATLSIGRAGGGDEEILLTGYELEEAHGRDRAVVAASVDPRTTRLQWRPAPPAPILLLSTDREGESTSDVLLLAGRIGLLGVAADGVNVETAGTPVRFAATGGDALAADVATATLARFTIGTGAAPAGARPRAPLLLQPQACWLRHGEPMRGADVAEPVHPLVDHWQVGNVTRRGVTLAVGSEWRVALPARATRLEFDLASLELASTPPNSPPPRLTVAVAANGRESQLGAVALAPASRADAPDRFDPVSWSIAWPIAAELPTGGASPAPRTLRFRVEAAAAAPFTSQMRNALLAEPRIIVGDAPAAANATPRRRMNLLIYLVDTLRADHVHCLGNERETTPNVDALARDGILFTHASSQAPWTRPSVASLFTGLIPEHHTVTSESGLPRAAATLAERMRAADFETAAFTANAQVHAAGLDFEQGFDQFTGYQLGDRFARSDEVLADALPWLDAHRDRPFFLYVHTIDPHDPYDPPPQTRGRFEREYHGRIDDTKASIGELMRLAPLTDDDKEHILALYDEEICFADQEFGRLIARLKELGLYDDTVILFLSDHGEELLDHGRLGHPRRLWNEVLHVPMVLRIPGATAPRGVVVDELVRTMDWLPTLASLFDLQAPEPGFEGVDLAPAWSQREFPELDAIAETEPDLESFQHGNFKLIVEQASLGERATARLFDFADDPHEQHDLAADRPEVVTSLRRLLAATKAGYAARGFAPLNARRVSHFDPAVERALRQLGYVDEGK